MSTSEPRRRDARHCPECGAMGILPLDQPTGADGEIQDPVMICPACEEEFPATGMRWLGAFNVGDMSDEEIHEVAVQIADMLGDAHEHDGDAG
jgi:phage terminase large subunit GpA-like protein